MKKFLLILLIFLLVYAAALSYDYVPPETAPAGPTETPADTASPAPGPTADIPQPTPEPTPSPTPTPAPTPTPTPMPDNGSYYITVNVQANTVTVYTLDEKGYYSIPCKAMICSTGPATPTSGVYGLGEQHRWHYLFGDVYGQ